MKKLYWEYIIAFSNEKYYFPIFYKVTRFYARIRIITNLARNLV